MVCCCFAIYYGGFGLLVAFLLLLVFTYWTGKPPNLTRHESEKYYVDPNKGKKKVRFPSIEDPPTVDLSVIVPAYNEELRLNTMMEETIEYLEGLKNLVEALHPFDQVGPRMVLTITTMNLDKNFDFQFLAWFQKEQQSFTYEVIIVDDGSKDSTTQKALEYSKRLTTDKVRVLTLERNRGKGGAVRVGMLSSRGNRLLFADADGASKFSDLKSLEDEMNRINTREDRMAIVCGSRAHMEKDSIAERSIFRTILMYGFHFLVEFLCVKGIKDTQCGFKLLTREAAKLIFRNLHVERWAFDVDMLYIAQHFNIPISEIAINWKEIEGSKLSPFWVSLQMGRDLFMIRLRYIIGAWNIDSSRKLD